MVQGDKDLASHPTIATTLLVQTRSSRQDFVEIYDRITILKGDWIMKPPFLLKLIMNIQT